MNASVRGKRAREKNKQSHLKNEEGEDLYVCTCMCVHPGKCGCINVYTPTCSGADKLQNQGPAGDNAGSTGQEVPEERHKSHTFI